MIKHTSANWVLVFMLTTGITGCAEVRKMISLFSKNGSIGSGSALSIDELSSGTDFTCALLGNRQIRCVGSGENGSMGTFHSATVTALKDVKQIATGNGFTCTISGENSAVHCFGNNSVGQLGNPVQYSSIDPVPVIDLDNNNSEITDAISISAGNQHACAVLKSGRAVCWGSNESGQLGNQTKGEAGAHSVLEQDRSTRAFAGVHSIAAGGNGTCMIAKNEQFVYCFGERFHENGPSLWIPKKVEIFSTGVPLNQSKQVAMGNGFGCALVRSQVYCWGLNDSKQLGAKTIDIGNAKAIPVEVSYPSRSALSKIEMITAGDKHACALHRDEGTIYCWGSNAHGQLGTTSTHGAPEQVAVTSTNLTLKRAKGVYAGKERTCTVATNDELYCWGNGAQGLLGSEITNSNFPVKAIASDGTNQTIQGTFSIGADHACGLTTQNKMMCFGLNTFGQLGSTAMASPVLSFTGRTPIAEVVSMDSFGHRTCIIHGKNREVACFGGKNTEAVNYRKNQNNFTIEEVTTGESKNYQGISAVADGELNLCLIHGDQTAECIDFKTRPPNHFFAESAPKKKIQDLWMVKTNGNLFCALTREKGEIWCWGEWRNIKLPTPQQIKLNNEVASNFVQLMVNDDQICGVSGSAGNVFCSTVAEGQFSLNLVPQQDVNGAALSGVFSLTNGKNHVCGNSNKGQLLCWGSNEYGQLGTKAVKNYSTKALAVDLKPEQAKQISKLSAGTYHTCYGTMTEASIHCFGKSFYGKSGSITPREFSL
jgi:alpha-tubulin suppressor-like RCC1 family protein